MVMQNSWNGFMSVSGSLFNMQEFQKELHAYQDKFGAVVFQDLNYGLLAKGINFSYENSNAINSVDFEILKNSTVAVVGESGSGKTTLVNLIAGLLTVEKGSLLVDNLEIKSFDMPTYQTRIGYITQEPVIFNDSIFNNVTFWDNPSDENILRFETALRTASILDFVESQPDGRNSILGSNGVNISGGQKQRISIARELYKNIDILILDEATSSLDSKTEYEIQENLNALKGKRTVIIVAHRLSTIKNADNIILLDKGCVLATGNFEQLHAKSDRFRKMVDFQTF
jgi:subfamily B ATP-binding cassette protein MsbA